MNCLHPKSWWLGMICKDIIRGSFLRNSLFHGDFHTLFFLYFVKKYWNARL